MRALELNSLVGRATAALLLLCCCSAGVVTTDAGPVDAGPADSGLGDAGGILDGGDAGAFRAWNANEVSILFPFPSVDSQLLAMRNPTDAGDRTLLEASLFHRLGDPDAGLPRFAEGAGTRDVYPELRVVSARIEPCFDGPDPIDGSCKRQLRLIAQLLDVPSRSFSDAAVHLFYALDEGTFLDVLAGLRKLSRKTPVTGPLGVHPVLSSEGLTGPFTEEVRSVILRACSSSNLTRVTFMATGRSKNWFFLILDRQPDGGFVQSSIPSRGDNDSFTDQGLTLFRMGTPFLVPWFPDALLTTGQTRALSAPEFLSAYDLLEKLKNPLVTRTRDVSCAACHVAEQTGVEALRERDAGPAPLTPSTYAGQGAASLALGNLHAFSYHFDAPTISERTANETAEVVRFLQSPAFVQSLSPTDRARLE